MVVVGLRRAAGECSGFEAPGELRARRPRRPGGRGASLARRRVTVCGPPVGGARGRAPARRQLREPLQLLGARCGGFFAFFGAPSRTVDWFALRRWRGCV